MNLPTNAPTESRTKAPIAAPPIPKPPLPPPPPPPPRRRRAVVTVLQQMSRVKIADVGADEKRLKSVFIIAVVRSFRVSGKNITTNNVLVKSIAPLVVKMKSRASIRATLWSDLAWRPLQQQQTSLSSSYSGSDNLGILIVEYVIDTYSANKSAIISSLTKAVDSHEFAETLRAEALTENCSALMIADVDSVSFTTSSNDDDDGNGGSDGGGGNNRTLIILIFIGSLVLILGPVGYFWYYYKLKTSHANVIATLGDVKEKGSKLYSSINPLQSCSSGRNNVNDDIID